MIRTCVHCEGEFDDASPAKQRAGGKITECPDCSEETETKYLGLQSAVQENLSNIPSEARRSSPDPARIAGWRTA